MGLPTPGKSRRRRTGSARNTAGVLTSYRSVVKSLLRSEKPPGSAFFIHMPRGDATKVTDRTFVYDMKDSLRKAVCDEMPWFNVTEEDQDGEILCSCGYEIPVSVKAFALRNRMRYMHHVTERYALGDAHCPGCSAAVALKSEKMMALTQPTEVSGFLKDSGLRYRILAPLRFNGEVYGPEWIKGVTIPTVGLNAEKVPPHPIGVTTVGDILKLARGDSMFSDEIDMDYKLFLPMKKSRHPYLVVKSAYWRDDEVTSAIINTWLRNVDKRRLIYLSGIETFTGLIGLRAYYIGKYIPLGYLYNVKFTWRDNIG